METTKPHDFKSGCASLESLFVRPKRSGPVNNEHTRKGNSCQIFHSSPGGTDVENLARDSIERNEVLTGPGKEEVMDELYQRTNKHANGGTSGAEEEIKRRRGLQGFDKNGAEKRRKVAMALTDKRSTRESANTGHDGAGRPSIRVEEEVMEELHHRRTNLRMTGSERADEVRRRRVLEGVDKNDAEKRWKVAMALTDQSSTRE